MKNKKTLTQRQEDFCLYYVIGNTKGNQTRSYMKAYPNASIKTAQTESYKLMKKPEIKQRMQQLTLEIQKRLRMRAYF